MSCITEYIQKFDGETRTQLESLHAHLKSILPEAEECISYNMPCFKQKKVVVYFAGYKNHVGFYPTSKPIEIFKDKLKGFKSSKGAIQFPLTDKLPKELILEIVTYRLNQISTDKSK